MERRWVDVSARMAFAFWVPHQGHMGFVFTWAVPVAGGESAAPVGDGRRLAVTGAG